MRDFLDRISTVWEGRGAPLGALELLLLLALSAAAAFLVALLYVRFYGARAAGTDLHRAFPLLAIAITAIFVCIQFSLPLSLGLLGALSIVRFRTPVKEPEEIGFLMVVIATSLACATGKLGFAGAVLAAAVAALALAAGVGPLLRRPADRGLLIATFDQAGYAARGGELLAALAAGGKRGALESLIALDGRVTVTWRFRGVRPEEAPALERLLRERAAPESLSIVFGADQPLP
jgi:hypothetical protein